MKKFGLLLIVLIVSGCVVIPKETITLSQTLGSDLKVLHNAHRNMVSIHYAKIKEDISSFVNDIYAPFIVNYVLKTEISNYQTGNISLFKSIELAGQKASKENSEIALKEMSDFLEAIRSQIESKRSDLLAPITKQETQILSALDQSYENAIYANSTITGYLQSLRKVKNTQEEALSMTLI
jgi:hypothetical protein